MRLCLIFPRHMTVSSRSLFPFLYSLKTFISFRAFLTDFLKFNFIKVKMFRFQSYRFAFNLFTKKCVTRLNSRSLRNNCQRKSTYKINEHILILTVIFYLHCGTHLGFCFYFYYYDIWKIFVGFSFVGEKGCHISYKAY